MSVPIPLVVLSGFDAVKEGLIKNSEAFAGTQVTPFYTTIVGGKGIFFSNGHTWKQQRKFGIITMRKLGLGKKGLESHIQEEANKLVQIFSCAKGQPIDPSLPILNSTCNVICALVFGYRYEVNDEVFLKLMKSIECIGKIGGTFLHLLYEGAPWLMKHIRWPYKDVFTAVDVMLSHAGKEIEAHRTKPASYEPQDFIDYYLLQMQRRNNDPTSTFDDFNLRQCISDFFSAGTDTTSATLQWALLLMVTHPDVQEKVQKEIDDVFGASQIISYEDRKKVPYTCATIHEIQRFKCILLAGKPRLCLQDVTILGSFIPKGTIIIPDVYSIIYDPKIWKTPREFNPNHFLDKDGKYVDKELFIFGAGARACPGKGLAQMELFTFFTSLMRAFTFKLPEGVTEVNLEPVKQIIMHPHCYKLCAIPRISDS